MSGGEFGWGGTSVKRYCGNSTLVIEEIETHGLNEKEFTDGLMHLVFKKKEKWKIENYRLITLLNTDYKTYTKTIAMRLAEVAKV